MECLTGKLQTAQPDPGDVAPADKTETPKTSSLPASQKTREGSLRAERISEPDASKDSPTPRKEMGSKETSADSEILDADSPRTTMDSGSLLPLDNINAYPHISAEMVDSSIIHMSDHLGDQVLSPQACQRISVKLEDDSFQDDSCNYILSQLDEERGLPWWDWPWSIFALSSKALGGILWTNLGFSNRQGVACINAVSYDSGMFICTHLSFSDLQCSLTMCFGWIFPIRGCGGRLLIKCSNFSTKLVIASLHKYQNDTDRIKVLLLHVISRMLARLGVRDDETLDQIIFCSTITSHAYRYEIIGL